MTQPCKPKVSSSHLIGCGLLCILQSSIEHSVLRDLLAPIRALYEDVRRKALMRLEYEGLLQAEAITTVGARFHGNPSGFALDRYAYYVCYKCSKAYYGGEVRCEEQAGGADHYDPAELICGACSDVSRAQVSSKVPHLFPPDFTGPLDLLFSLADVPQAWDGFPGVQMSVLLLCGCLFLLWKHSLLQCLP